MANRVSQTPLEVLTETTNAKARVSQAPLEALVETTNAKTRVTQAVVEVLLPGITIYTRTATDTTSISSSISRVANKIRTASDTKSVTESVGKGPAFRLLIDMLATTDHITTVRGGASARSATDTTSVSDTVVRGSMVFHRLLADTVITVDELDYAAIPPVASFTASLTSGSEPLRVQFVDTTLYNPTSWFWDFGDGTTSLEQNPYHIYAAGTYTVTLTVQNDTGSNTVIETSLIVAAALSPEMNQPRPTVDVVIDVDGTDYADDTRWADAMFTAAVNGSIGRCKFAVLDRGHDLSFLTGKTIDLFIAGIHYWSGFVEVIHRNYSFDVDDTTNAETVVRWFIIEGFDVNVLLSGRVAWNIAHPTRALRPPQSQSTNPPQGHEPLWKAGGPSDVVVKYVLENYTLLAADGVTFNEIINIGSPNPDTSDHHDAGITVAQYMTEINGNLNGIFYLRANRSFVFRDVEVATNPFILTDTPVGGGAGGGTATATDLFGRTVSGTGNWGTGPLGAWSASASQAGTLSVDGADGLAVSAGVLSVRQAIHCLDGPAASADSWKVTTSFTWPAEADSALFYNFLDSGTLGSDWGVYATIDRQSGIVTAGWYDTVGGAEASTAFTYGSVADEGVVSLSYDTSTREVVVTYRENGGSIATASITAGSDPPDTPYLDFDMNAGDATGDVTLAVHEVAVTYSTSVAALDPTYRVGPRDFLITSDATKMVNDALVWGAALGIDHMVFSRVQDPTSQSEHGRWQTSDRPSLFHQWAADHRANALVYGNKPTRHGAKDDQTYCEATVFRPIFQLGDVVRVEQRVFDGTQELPFNTNEDFVAINLPVRTMEITFPSPNHPRFRMVLTEELDEPWNTMEFGPLLPIGGIPTPPVIDIGDGKVQQQPCEDSCSNVTVLSQETSEGEIGIVAEYCAGGSSLYSSPPRTVHLVAGATYMVQINVYHNPAEWAIRVSAGVTFEMGGPGYLKYWDDPIYGSQQFAQRTFVAGGGTVAVGIEDITRSGFCAATSSAMARFFYISGPDARFQGLTSCEIPQLEDGWGTVVGGPDCGCPDDCPSIVGPDGVGFGTGWVTTTTAGSPGVAVSGGVAEITEAVGVNGDIKFDYAGYTSDVPNSVRCRVKFATYDALHPGRIFLTLGSMSLRAFAGSAAGSNVTFSYPAGLIDVSEPFDFVEGAWYNFHLYVDGTFIRSRWWTDDETEFGSGGGNIDINTTVDPNITPADFQFRVDNFYGGSSLTDFIVDFSIGDAGCVPGDCIDPAVSPVGDICEMATQIGPTTFRVSGRMSGFVADVWIGDKTQTPFQGLKQLPGEHRDFTISEQSTIELILPLEEPGGMWVCYYSEGPA